VNCGQGGVGKVEEKAAEVGLSGSEVMEKHSEKYYFIFLLSSLHEILLTELLD